MNDHKLEKVMFRKRKLTLINYYDRNRRLFAFFLSVVTYSILFTSQLSAQGKVYQRPGDDMMSGSYRFAFNYFNNGDEIAVFNTSTTVQDVYYTQWTVLKTDSQTGQISSHAFACAEADNLVDVITYPDNSYSIILSFINSQFFIFKFSASNQLLWKKAIEIPNLYLYNENKVIDNGQGGVFIMISDANYAGIINLENNGNILWSKKISGFSSKSPGFALCRGNNGGVVGTLKNDSFECIFSLDQNGNEIWNKTFLDEEYRWPKKIMQTEDGNYLLAGDINMSLAYYHKISPSGDIIFAKKIIPSSEDFLFATYTFQDLISDSVGNNFMICSNGYNNALCVINPSHQITQNIILTNSHSSANFAQNAQKFGIRTNVFSEQGYTYAMTMEVDEVFSNTCASTNIDAYTIIDDIELLNATQVTGVNSDNLTVNIMPSPMFLQLPPNAIDINNYCNFAQLSETNDIGIVNIFPNPASESLTISLPNNASTTDCILFDNLGKEVRRFSISGGENMVNVSTLETGSYLVKIGTQLQKIMKY